MSEVFDNFEQRSEEWFALRLGIPTASEFASIMAKGQGRTRRGYLMRLAAERLTGELQEGYRNSHMQRGRDWEDDALDLYQFVHNIEVKRVGFIRIMTAGGWSGCSPDGLVDPDGLVEVKTRLPALMIDAMLQDGPPGEYKPQVQGGLWISGRRWCDLVCFNPSMPLHVVRVERDEEYIATLADEVSKFTTELAAIEARFGGDATAILREQLEASL
jgi:hypothetical protein